jgi:sugar phosphate isomerase/epimerase
MCEKPWRGPSSGADRASPVGCIEDCWPFFEEASMDRQASYSRRRWLLQAASAGAALALSPSLSRMATTSRAADAPKPRWEIGTFTRPFAAWDYRTAMDAIAESGYRYLGLMTAKSPGGLVLSADSTLDHARTVGREAKKRGLAINSVYGGGYPVAKDAISPAVKALRHLIDATAAAEATSLMMGGNGDPQLQKSYYKIIAECCDYAADKNILLTVKPHGGLNGTGPQCRECIDLVGHKNFRLWYDPGNIFYYSNGKLDPVDDAATVDGLVAGMSVKDYVHPLRVDVTPGDGRVAWKKLMQRLRQGGFTSGPMVVECLAAGSLKETIQQAKRARIFLEELIA